MSLRSKIVLSLCAVVLLFVGADNAVHRLAMGRVFEGIETGEAVRDLERAKGSVRQAVRSLEGTGQTLAAVLAAGGVPQEELLELHRTDVDLLLLASPTGESFWCREALLPADLPADVREPRAPDVSGLLMTTVGPMLTSAHTVSVGAQGREWRLVLGRFLYSGLTSALGVQVLLDFDVWPLDPEHLPQSERHVLPRIVGREHLLEVREDGLLYAYATLPDYRGRPALLVRALIERDVWALGRQGVEDSLLSALTTSVLVLLTIAWLLQRIVIQPLRRLTATAVEIGASDDPSLRVGAEDRADEIGQLAREFDRMLGKLEVSRRQTTDAARAAGMAEIATGVLHNVGTELTSVTVSASELRGAVQHLAVEDLRGVVEALEERRGELGRFLEEDERGRHVLPLLAALASDLGARREAALGELTSLAEGIERIHYLVASQQDRAMRSEVRERAALEDLVEAALDSALSANGCASGLQVVREYEPLPRLSIDQRRVRDILEHVILNAVQATEGRGRRRMVLRLLRARSGATVEVEDNGPGIPAEERVRVFTQGFTTKDTGLGFGLHVAATVAMEMGATLSVHDARAEGGALFRLELPVSVMVLGAPGPAANGPAGAGPSVSVTGA